MTTVDPKQNYYKARDLRLTLEAKRNDYMSKSGTTQFDGSVFGKLGDLYKDAKRNEFFSECDFDNANSKKFDEALSHMSNPNLPW